MDCHSDLVDRIKRTSLTKKKEQDVILARVQWLDQLFRLEQIHRWYQTYLDPGSKHQNWPVCTIRAEIVPLHLFCLISRMRYGILY